MTALPRRLLSLAVTSFVAMTVLSSGLAAPVETATAASYPSSYERLWGDNCLAWERVLTPKTTCVYGDRTSKVVVAVVGDSHISHLFPAIERIAIARHWKLVVMVKVSCGFVDMRIRNLHLGREYYECATWNRNVVARLNVLKPTLTLVAQSRYAIHQVLSSQSSNTAKGQAEGRLLKKVPGQVALIVDSPRRGQSSVGAMGAIEKVAGVYSGDSVINLTPDTCSRWPCPSSAGGITKFRDTEHFNAAWSRAMLGRPGGILDRAMDARL
ncbi:MAG: SGNH hydrolase domain-containing protein [Chloroflexota bacterium]